ncbi:LytTR family DNA-binding domain-containing protein [Dielma fastidiosa]|uniref:LytTR family DNA-binding domain-containing protein n=1 Tax=Dielma fastidiosa TaxID=1034346 RepID=UPI00356730BD
MKIKIEHGDYEENEILLRCREVDSEIMRIIAFLNLHTQKLSGWKSKEEITMLEFKDVYYAEALEDKTFLYTSKDVYQTALNLAEIEGRYESLGFLRISKSVVVNLYAIHSLKSALAGRIEIILKNQEKLIVSRHYAPLLRERIGL